MKRKHYIYVACAFLMALTSCKRESFLNRIPLSNISPQGFFNNETDLQLYCNQYYTSLPIQNFYLADDNSDDKANASINQILANTYTIPPASSNKDLPGTGSSTLPDGTFTGVNWNFSLIRTCNFFIASYNKANVTTALKNVYLSETLFFRANEFYKKVKAFGDVPYINKYITDTSTAYLYGPRMPHQQVMDSVLKDMNFAVNNLPATVPAAQTGRLTKNMALAMLARMCLWEGTYRKYFPNSGDPTVYLQTAASAAEQLMASGQYGIYTTGTSAASKQSDYYNLFIQDDLSGNKEAILPMRYIQNVLMNGIDRSLGQGGDGYTKNFVRSYLCTDGLPTSLSPLYKGDDSIEVEIQNRDPRLKQTIATRGFDLLNGDLITYPRVGTTATSTGYQPIKGRSNSLAAWAANASVYDFFIFRYAEILLIDAEARAELGTATQTVIDNTINLLRDRVGMPRMNIASLVKDPQSNFPSLPVLIDEIRRERRVELASEGFRFDDMHRWNAGTLINNPETILGIKMLPAYQKHYTNTISVNSNFYVQVYPGTTRTWNNKMYLFPIPIQEITLNPALKQNPGW